ncbi:MAG: DUF1015 domain-containing protein [Candidatus Abyssubacteria bacterium]
MARIIPFRGLRYDSSRVNPKEIVAPPYDVITDEQNEFLQRRHPNNIARLTNPIEMPGDGPDNNKYIRARQNLQRWIADRILQRDDRPALYIYEQEYKYSADTTRVRRGFIALARLDDEASGAILGHEQTHMLPKRDRLNLMKECKANLSPIFSLYSQPDGAIDSILVETAFTPPAYDFMDDNGVRNRLWVVTDPDLINDIATQMNDKPIIIADGHHRYETALIYRHIRRSERPNDPEDAPYNYTMMMFVNLDGEGVTIYPIHRLIHGLPDFDPQQFRSRLEEYFEITPSFFDCSTCETTARNFMADLARLGETTHAFGLYLGGDKLELLRSKDDIKLRNMVDKTHCESYRTLDVAVAEAVILKSILGIGSSTTPKEEHVRYTPSDSDALASVRLGETQIALLLNPTKPEQVKAVTYEGEKMPQKSTYFYPKLLSGLVINPLE